MINMNQEYRKELRDLKAQERELAKGMKHVAQSARKEISVIQRNVEREGRSVNKKLLRIAKRRAVLEGRLS